ncbi:MAG: CBS domain-containing protein [Candidatus Izemoplasmatales bacterium]|nr:CBS domain-containing protein [Candidatus Izemoplasmatales bacterium]
MDIISFVKHKPEVIYVYDDFTLKEALELMEKHRFTSIPILSRDGKYIGSITEGDLLWKIIRIDGYNSKKADALKVTDIERCRDYLPIRVDQKMDELILKAAEENFVPIIDENDLFIGIVTRKTILTYFFEHNFIVL